jgi:hypothetical protein
VTREPWSINAVSMVLGTDRRTIAKHVLRANVKPAAEGSHGPLYALRDVVRVLADAGVLGDPERAASWGGKDARDAAARDLAEQLLETVPKRLGPKPLRAFREVLGAELHGYLESLHHDPERPDYWLTGDALDWKALSDAELGEALRALIEDGFLPDDEEVDK